VSGRVVIGYDGTGSGDDALALGAIICRAIGDAPLVVSVYPEENPIGIGRVDAEWVAYMRDHATGHGPRRRGGVPGHVARGRAGGARPRAPSMPKVPATGELLEGDVVDELAALDDREVDLLVCGSRGYGPVRRVLLGGVSSRLIRRAACPVVVVPRCAE
jgi:nucleotide-binding universal stress UspA family protein